MMRKDETPEAAYERTIAKELQDTLADTLSQGAGPAAAPGGSAGEAGPSGDDGGRARPPGSDPKPRGGRPMGKPRKADAELVKVWSELLTLPAIPMGLPVHDPTLDTVIPATAERGPQLIPGMRPRCEHCRDHFIRQGPVTAVELVKLGEQSEPLRRVLERVADAWDLLTVAGALGAYLTTPLLHHVAPQPVLDGIGPVLGVPPRPPRVPRGPRGHHHAPPDAAAAAPAA
jgi:hypothetical protein